MNSQTANGEGVAIGREYIPKLRSKPSKIDYTKYKFYNKNPAFRFVKFLHRGVADIFLRAYLKAVHKVKVVGKHNADAIGKKSGAVIVSNHIHPLDIQMIATFIFGMRSVHWLTLERNMELSVAPLIRTSGGVPIPEDREQKKRCFAEMNELLRDGGLLHVCPEGSLVELCDGIRPFKDGAFRFAFYNKVPVLPVTLRFEQYSPKGKKYRHPHFIIDVAEPIYPTVPQETMRDRARSAMLRRCNRLSQA